ncbi:FAD-dependent oxidoreductase [Herbiconiux sp. L3-i23]|uniref:FAD-dependent oxidoreductase n=1 Tax=Herbiconiux sp. L3-i23 TaxID=2905871 RepID=UPI00205887A6|nr:oxidoreductase [Herbiconiux sp. L3-i23]BDI23305.1 hypothetical protein L3i23_20810 [Herbiconiux sp. L3-i23]
MTAIAAFLDRVTGRVPMYRLLTIVLAATFALAVILSLTGQLFYPAVDLVASAAVAILVGVIASKLLGLVFRVPVHTESSIITGYLLTFLMLPTTDLGGLAVIALASLLAAASKFVIAWRGRHLLNPAAAGVFLVALTGLGAAGWWVATPLLLPVVAIGAILVLWRTRTHWVGLTFMVLATALVVPALIGFGSAPLDAVWTAIGSYPIVFLGAFMLTEPSTLPPRRRQQIIVAAVVAVLFALPLYVSVSFGTFYLSQEFALLVGNLVAAALILPTGQRLRFLRSRPVGPDAVEYTFETARPLRAAKPGQYAELHLPHPGVDQRGARRHLSLVGTGGDSRELSIAVRTPERSSSFKRRLASLEPGDEARATWLGGDFVLPDDAATPVLLVAGGIGITPFVASFASPREAVLVYRVRSEDDVLYRAELEASGWPVLLVTPTEPASLPASWRWAPDLDTALAAVGDAKDRNAFVSGAPSFVNRARSALRGAGVRRIRTDRFSGY